MNITLNEILIEIMNSADDVLIRIEKLGVILEQDRKFVIDSIDSINAYVAKLNEFRDKYLVKTKN